MLTKDEAIEEVHCLEVFIGWLEKFTNQIGPANLQIANERLAKIKQYLESSNG